MVREAEHVNLNAAGDREDGPTKGFWSITNLKAHSRRWRIASQTVSSTLTRAYRLQLDSTIVHGAYGVVVRCNISSTASRY